jgi:RimJ/RimL family protein N-acetyltransferase
VKTDGEWRDVGVVNVSDLDDVPEVGLFIGEVALWGRGIGTAGVNFAVDWLADQGYDRARSRIMEDNDGSIRLFEKVGFEHVGPARPGEIEFQIDLAER